MIRINRPAGYLVGLILGFAIYFIAQLTFFINTEKTMGRICDITGRRAYEYYFACFTTRDSTSVSFYAGSNLDYYVGDTVNIIYKRNNPFKARIAGMIELWIWPALYFLVVPLIIIMALVTGLYYPNRVVVITKKPFRISTIIKERNNSY